MTEQRDQELASAIQPKTPAEGEAPADHQLVAFHLRLGWWSLLVFLVLGFLLEVLHGLKIDWYLNVAAEPRRLMWTLAHAHGTLLGLLHMAFAVTVALRPGWSCRSRSISSRCLTSAGFLLPLGFFLGGCFIYSGDPGMGVLLVPVGAFLLGIAVALTARNMHGRRG